MRWSRRRADVAGSLTTWELVRGVIVDLVMVLAFVVVDVRTPWPWKVLLLVASVVVVPLALFRLLGVGLRRRT